MCSFQVSRRDSGSLTAFSRGFKQKYSWETMRRFCILIITRLPPSEPLPLQMQHFDSESSSRYISEPVNFQFRSTEATFFISSSAVVGFGESLHCLLDKLPGQLYENYYSLWNSCVGLLSSQSLLNEIQSGCKLSVSIRPLVRAGGASMGPSRQSSNC